MCLPGTEEAVRARGLTVTRRGIIGGGAAAAAAALLPAGAQARGGGRGKAKGRPRTDVADLTHVFRAGFPVYAGAPPARRALATVEADGFFKQQWTFDEHSGTHVDVPGHFIAGGRFVTQLAPSELVLPLAVIDIAARAARDPDTVVTPDDLRRYERRHGRIPDGALVAMASGWDARAGDAAAFRNTDAGGTFHFPGFGLAAVEWLLEERRAAAIGVDTLSLDHGPSTTFSVHTAWLGADRYGVENLAGLRSVPPKGAVATVGVIPWEQGSGGPARVLATF